MLRVTLRMLALATLLIGAAPEMRAMTCDTTRNASKDSSVVKVAVRNDAFLDVAVWVVRDGFRYRLGTASGLGKTTFTVPMFLSRGLSSLRFVVHPIGGRGRDVSEEVLVSPGDEIELLMPAWR